VKLTLVVLLAAVVATAQPVNWNWSWTAPEPPLPNTQYVDYGWDSTSNYVPYYVIVVSVQRAHRIPPPPPAPMPPPVVRRTK